MEIARRISHRPHVEVLVRTLLFSLLFALSAQAATSQEILSKAKSSYLEAHWDQFFGLASLARLNWKKSNERSELLLLESLAFIRHCQWEQAGRSIAIGKADGLLRSDFETAESLLPINPITKTESSRLEKTQYWWPIPALYARNPFQIRRKIENKCEGSDR